ncbi:PD-(D/E)XK nuclease-like domain-containing protein [Roseovarius sp. MMSF_3281]|uniref:PD-(D/E)XK nuclease-like domain-containing protein n=1 Tax=Roseovarius sp. MMSF_3281 TaxID=3046694 RepID=UPI0027402D4C|nr:PD-(D/E)XK nuclease-like domain-containing protein [Roseovarius sp. MMSF_3281]
MRDISNFLVRDLKDDEKITEPGFYRIPMERHHGQPCDGVSVTSSVLRKMEIQTPADVWAFHGLNPDRYEREQTDALRMGRAMAAFIEGGPEELERHFRVLPKDKPKRPTEVQLTAFKEGRASDAALKSIYFWQKVEEDPRDIVTEAEWELICNMGKVLAQDPAASAALGGEPEITMAWYDHETDLWCLARPDQTSFDGMLSDYKKVNTQGRPFSYRVCDNRITDHGYHQQMAFAREGFVSLIGEEPQQVGLVFQVDKAPYHVILREVDEEALAIGEFQNRRARRLFRECLDSNNWWGPGEDIGAYQMPSWFRERLIEEMQTAGVAP